MQSFGHAHIFLYCKPKVDMILLALYIELGNLLSLENMSPKRLNKSFKLESDHPYFPFKFYNLTSELNLVYVSQLG